MPISKIKTRAGVKYDASVMIGGKRYRKRFPTEKEAHQYLADLADPVEDISLPGFIEKYRAYSRAVKSESTRRVDNGRLKIFLTWCADNGLTALNDINMRSIESFKQWYLSDNRNRNPKATFNKYLQLIKGMLNWAVRQGYMQNNSIKYFEHLKDIGKKFARYFTTDELKIIFKASQEPYTSYFKILAYTGMRAGELHHLEWSDIDGQIIKIQSKPGFHPKTYEIRAISINERLRSVLNKLPIYDSRIIGYQITTGAALKVLKNILRLNGLPDGNLYTFRHTFASHLVMNGVDLNTVKRLMGHASITTTEQYLHLAPERSKDAVDRLTY